MKRVCKIVLIFLIIFMVTSTCFTAKAGDLDIWGTGGTFLNKGSSAADDGSFTMSNVTVPFEGVIDFLWGLGLLVVFISTIVLGIKYMLVNPNEKSRVKQATTPYIIGVVIIFGAVTIWKLIIDMLEGSMLGK